MVSGDRSDPSHRSELPFRWSIAVWNPLCRRLLRRLLGSHCVDVARSQLGSNPASCNASDLTLRCPCNVDRARKGKRSELSKPPASGRGSEVGKGAPERAALVKAVCIAKASGRTRGSRGLGQQGRGIAWGRDRTRKGSGSWADAKNDEREAMGDRHRARAKSSDGFGEDAKDWRFGRDRHKEGAGESMASGSG